MQCITTTTNIILLLSLIHCTSLVQVQQTAHIVGYCYNKYECWSVAVVSDMDACRCKFNRHDCWLGATVKDMENDRLQLLQTLLMVGCKCNLHGCHEDEIEIDIHAENKQIIKLVRCNCNIHALWSGTFMLTSPLVGYYMNIGTYLRV